MRKFIVESGKKSHHMSYSIIKRPDYLGIVVGVVLASKKSNHFILAKVLPCKLKEGGKAPPIDEKGGGQHSFAPGNIYCLKT